MHLVFFNKNYNFFYIILNQLNTLIYWIDNTTKLLKEIKKLKIFC